MIKRTDINNLFRHPLVLLLIGALITSILIPAFQELKEDRDEQRRLVSRLIIIDSDINARFNLIITAFENYQKDGLLYTGPESKDDMREQVYQLYQEFDSIAWTSLDSVIGGAYASGLIQSNSYDALQAFSDDYRDVLIMRTKALDPVWNFLRGNALNDNVDGGSLVRSLRNRQDELSSQGRETIFKMVRLLR